MRIAARLILASLLIVTLPAPADPSPQSEFRPEEITVPRASDYVHPASGMRFPPRAGAFARIDVIKYLADASDVGVGYNLARPRTTMTVYVAPALGRTGRQYFDEARAAVTQKHAAATEISNEPFTLDQGDRALKGLRAVFTFDDATTNGVTLHLRSEVYVFELHDHLLKYRVTYQVADADAAAKRIAEFMSALALPPAE